MSLHDDLKKFDLFNELNEADFDMCYHMLKGKFMTRKVPSGAFLYQNEEIGGCLQFVYSGLMSTTYLNPDGSQFPSFFYPPGSICGITHYLLADGKTNMGKTGHLPKAMKNSVCWEIRACDMDRIVEAVPELYRVMTRYCASCYMDLGYISNILRIPSARTRIGYYLTIRERPTKYTVMPNFLLKECNISLLADILGLNRSTTSRELNRMARLGILQLEPEIRLLDKKKLTDYLSQSD